jgi:protein-tyrosine phosphatase
MPSVLFVCLANRFRSPLAAAYLHRCLEKFPGSEDWSIESAGTWTEEGLPADKRALKEARGWGIDLKNHHSRQVDAAMIARNNLILVMDAGQKEALQIEFPKARSRIYLLSEMADDTSRDVADPYGPGRVPHNEIIVDLFDLIKRGLDRIIRLASVPDPTHR